MRQVPNNTAPSVRHVRCETRLYARACSAAALDREADFELAFGHVTAAERLSLLAASIRDGAAP